MARDVRQLKRAKPRRRPRALLLAVCEGQKTEPNYFAGFKRSLKLANVELEIFGRECGSDPLSVVKFAQTRFQKDRSIDECYSIIDRDTHDSANFNAAKVLADSVNSKSGKRKFILIVSDPSIEYWFLLHKIYTRSPFVEKGAKSRADVLLDVLRKHYPGYAKNSKDVFSALEPEVGSALEHADRAEADAKATGEPNPSTDVHLIIRRFADLGRSGDR